MSFPLFFLFISSCPGAFGANILGVFSITSVSHQVVYRTLTLELNRRGHNLTVITPDPAREPGLTGYREIDTSFFYETWNRKMVAKPKELRLSLIFPELFIGLFVATISSEMCHAYLSHPEVRALIDSDPKFDLVILEFGVNPCLYGFTKFSGFRHVGIFSFQTNPVVHANIGNPIVASYLPDVDFPYTDRMSFPQRLRNFAFQIFMWIIYGYTMWSQDYIAKEYFGPDLPHIVELERNLSALLINTHFAMDIPRPLVPNMIEIAGPAFHLSKRRPRPLSKELKEFMDDAPDGVVYFSLGSNVKTNNMKGQEEKILVEAFGRLKQKILWKWDDEDLRLDLKNVKKAKWFPQVDILAHPNVKVFVTQGGLQSMGEAIEYHVPMVVMPFFADQGHNARKMESVGVAKYLDFGFMTVESFTQAINQVAYNKSYKENIIKFSNLVKDQPMPPLERAVWWTEYVIRHNGAPHLRSPAATMPWYKYLNLDVVAVLLLAVYLLIYLSYLLIRKLARFISKRKQD